MGRNQDSGWSMDGVLITLSIIIAYLLGSIPSAYIMGRMRKGTDIREEGTRNMGAMNVFYTIGFWWGFLVLAMDVGKGAAAMGIAYALGVHEVARFLAGAAAVMGHGFPVFIGFRGGKGGATCIGVLYIVMPWGIPFTVVIFGLMLLVTRYPTLSYSLSLLAFPFLGWLHYERWEFIVFSLGLVVIPLIRYIPRLKEMKNKAGNWSHVFRRTNLEDRY